MRVVAPFKRFVSIVFVFDTQQQNTKQINKFGAQCDSTFFFVVISQFLGIYLKYNSNFQLQLPFVVGHFWPKGAHTKSGQFKLQAFEAKLKKSFLRSFSAPSSWTSCPYLWHCLVCVFQKFSKTKPFNSKNYYLLLGEVAFSKTKQKCFNKILYDQTI